MSQFQIDFSPITGSVGYRSAVLWEKNYNKIFTPQVRFPYPPWILMMDSISLKDTNLYHVSSYDVIFELVLQF